MMTMATLGVGKVFAWMYVIIQPHKKAGHGAKADLGRLWSASDDMPLLTKSESAKLKSRTDLKWS